MVSQLISGCTRTFDLGTAAPYLQGSSSPKTSHSASTPKLFRARLPGVTPSRQFFIDFACQDQPMGRVVIQMAEGTGLLGEEFEALLTGKHGFGYKGSRVFACCQNEWCLMGDLLYDSPPAITPGPHDWDPLEDDFDDDEDDANDNDWNRYDRKRSGPVKVDSPRTLHHGYRGVAETQETGLRDIRGSVVAVASDLDLDTWTWMLGPQFKICLSDSVVRSGRVVGQVTEGLEVAHRLSQMGGNGHFEPSARITLTNCGCL